MPSRPIRWRPNGVFSSKVAGVAWMVIGWSLRSTVKVSGVPALPVTVRYMALKSPIFSPSIAVITSPGWKPAWAATLFGSTDETRAGSS